MRVFFCKLDNIASFFTNVAEKIDVLNEVVGRKLIAQTNWDFENRAVNVGNLREYNVINSVYVKSKNKFRIVKLLTKWHRTFTGWWNVFGLVKYFLAYYTTRYMMSYNKEKLMWCLLKMPLEHLKLISTILSKILTQL